jgi:hypothetical protein
VAPVSRMAEEEEKGDGEEPSWREQGCLTLGLLEVRLCSWGDAFSFEEGHPLSQVDAALQGAQ